VDTSKGKKASAECVRYYFIDDTDFLLRAA
jgi:hypothetical protein